MVPSILLIGCQVTIISVGDVAFDVIRLDGLRWAVSVGIAALTIPLGSLARLLSFDPSRCDTLQWPHDLVTAQLS